MLGLVWVVVCAAAAYRLHGSDLFVPALIVAILNFSSWAVLMEFRERYFPPVITRFWSPMNFLTTVIGVILLIAQLWL